MQPVIRTPISTGSFVDIDGELYETMDTWHGDSWGPPLDGEVTVVNPFEYPKNMNTRTLVLLPGS